MCDPQKNLTPNKMQKEVNIREDLLNFFDSVDKLEAMDVVICSA